MTNQCKGITLLDRRCKRRSNTKIYCYSHENQKPYNDECPVCLEDGNIVLKCKHSICEKCYHSTMKIKAVCPICRAKVDIDEKHCVICFAITIKEHLSLVTDDVIYTIFILIMREQRADRMSIPIR